jgi:hypothetical protein
MRIKTSELKEKHYNGLQCLMQEDSIPPGIAVALMSNLNMVRESMPANVFRHLDYSAGFDDLGDIPVLSEAFSRIENRHVKIDNPKKWGLGEFQMIHSPIRVFRPKRNAKKLDIKLNEPCKGFNYSSRECDFEVFETKKFGDMKIDLMYNKYPFAPYHFLLIPNRKGPEKGEEKGKIHNQFLDSQKDSKILEYLVSTIKSSDKEVRLCYNSLGAHASVNHLHFQGFLATRKMPIDKYFENENLRDDFYFKGTRWIPKDRLLEGLKENISEINQRDKNGEKIAYCFYLTPNGGAFFPRKHQSSSDYFNQISQSSISRLTGGFAFYEMLGNIVCPDPNASSLADKEILENWMKRLYGLLELNDKPK